jgi:LAO/AO transport system kinase
VSGPGASSPEAILKAAQAGDRRALGRAITLIESTRADHRSEARALLETALPASGGSVRIGITGTPGVGKSTFIERFGLTLIDQGLKVAVIAVDPSSRRSGGSILGDKTRMPELSRNHQAFIRPSPSAGTLGGVARRTRETLLLLEAVGYDVVIVETVGVGQSETAVAEMVDVFLLLLSPGGGDELQGIKKGVVELADIMIVNKADGDLEAAARRAAGEYRHALDLLRPSYPEWTPKVLQCSALTGKGVAEVWETIGAFRETLAPAGRIEARRAEQARAWFWQRLEEGLLEALKADSALAAKLPALEKAVMEGERSPTAAAEELLAAFLNPGGSSKG